jgi:hypothetical protein
MKREEFIAHTYYSTNSVDQGSKEALKIGRLLQLHCRLHVLYCVKSHLLFVEPEFVLGGHL